MRGLQLLEAIHQAIVGGIGNFRLVQHVIEIFVVAQLVAQISISTLAATALAMEPSEERSLNTHHII